MTHKAKKGFTLIEIVIVLAIAALILVVVFFAVQGAQRNQRNDARKNLASRVLAQYQTYLGNNPAGTPAQFVNVRAQYITDAELNINGTAYVIAAANPLTNPCNVGTQLNLSTNNGRATASVCTETATTGIVFNAQ